MRVKCSVVEEFLEELALDAHVVEEGIVRVTLRYQPLPDAPLVALSVMAGVVVGGKIVELRHQIGNCFWPPSTEQDKTLQTKAREVRNRIVVKAQELNLVVRAGVFEP
jgi:xanthosine utilization system XapX-like protein